MEQLLTFLDRFGRRRNARHWSGARPDARAKALPRAIASMIGYPTSEDGWSEKHDLQQVDLKTAAEVLALAATESLAYGRRGARESYLKLAAAALGEFGADAVFLTNTKGWELNGSMSWSAKLTTATFEAGLIAYDRENAMIFWVEEED